MFSTALCLDAVKASVLKAKSMLEIKFYPTEVKSYYLNEIRWVSLTETDQQR